MALALWLCRLDADGLDAARSATDQARLLGIGAWVLPLQSGTELDAGLDALREVYALDGGLPLLVEWTIREPCSLAEEQRVIRQLAPLLQSARALLLEQRPVLLLKGTQHLAQPEHSANRLRRCLARAGDRLPWLINGSHEPAAGFDAGCEWMPPPRWQTGTHRLNYELFLQRAHWRDAPQRRCIPSVRGLPGAATLL